MSQAGGHILGYPYIVYIAWLAIQNLGWMQVCIELSASEFGL